MGGAPSTQGDLFQEVNRDGDVRRYSEVHDDGYYTALCWVEIITLKEYKNGSSDVKKEYAILFESPGDIPEQYLEKRVQDDEVVPYEVVDNDTKKSHVVNFTRVDVTKEATVLENRKMLCGSGPMYTEEFIKWPKSSKKRIEIKVSPKKNDALTIKPLRVQESKDEPVQIQTDQVSNTSENKAAIKDDDVKIDVADNQHKETSPQNGSDKNTDTKNNGNDKRKKKKKLVSETASTKRISSYRSTIHDEPDGGQPITRRYVLETTVTKPTATTPDGKNSTSDELQAQPSVSNAIIALSPYIPHLFPQRTKPNSDSLCSKNKEHILFLKINIVMEHKVIPRRGGDTLVFPVMEMEKQVEFDVHPNSINRSESVTSLSVNEKWENLLIDLTHGRGVNNENHNSRYSSSNHFNSGGYSNTVSLDEATKYVSQLQNSLGVCVKYGAKNNNDRKASLRKRKITNADLLKDTKKANSNDDFGKFPSEAHAINYYLNQPIAKAVSTTKRSIPTKELKPDIESKNKNKTMVMKDLKRNRSTEEYIIEEMIDQQPSDTSSKRVVPGKPLKHIRKFKRIVIHSDDPDNAQVEEYSEVSDDGTPEIVVQKENELTTTPSIVIDTEKPASQTLSPETTTETQAVPVVPVSEVRDDNIFVKVLGTLTTILRRLAA